MNNSRGFYYGPGTWQIDQLSELFSLPGLNIKGKDFLKKEVQFKTFCEFVLLLKPVVPLQKRDVNGNLTIELLTRFKNMYSHLVLETICYEDQPSDLVTFRLCIKFGIEVP